MADLEGEAQGTRRKVSPASRDPRRRPIYFARNRYRNRRPNSLSKLFCHLPRFRGQWTICITFRVAYLRRFVFFTANWYSRATNGYFWNLLSKSQWICDRSRTDYACGERLFCNGKSAATRKLFSQKTKKVPKIIKEVVQTKIIPKYPTLQRSGYRDRVVRGSMIELHGDSAKNKRGKNSIRICSIDSAHKVYRLEPYRTTPYDFSRLFS